MIPDLPFGFTAQPADEINAAAHHDVNGHLSSVELRIGDVAINVLPEQAGTLRHAIYRAMAASEVPPPRHVRVLERCDASCRCADAARPGADVDPAMQTGGTR